MKFQNIKNKEKILKSSSENEREEKVSYKEMRIRMTLDFSSAALDDKTQGAILSKF